VSSPRTLSVTLSLAARVSSSYFIVATETSAFARIEASFFLSPAIFAGRPAGASKKATLEDRLPVWHQRTPQPIH
jgi:hypothetical protein